MEKQPAEVSMTATAPRLWFAAFTILAVPLLARADVVIDWNKIAIASAVAAKQDPAALSRTMAILHTAMFDAMNAVEPGYRPYKVNPSAPAGASMPAAGIAAAHAALASLFPGEVSSLDAAYATHMAQVQEGPGKDAGIAVGRKAAAEIMVQRASDGSDVPKPYRPSAAAGTYVPTMLPLLSNWGDVRPWVLERGSQLRPQRPPLLTSAEWARDYNEIKDLGGRISTARTPEQTDIARFWTIVGPPAWNPVVQQVAAAPGRGLLQNARLFALVAMATADAYIAVFDAKYTFNFWRPITAIRNGDLDGNDATQRQPDWEPLVDTPLHPEYPCAHCITSSAVAAVLDAEFGTGPLPPIAMTSPTAPGVVRKWNSSKEYADEVAAARIYGGVHYRTSNMVGQAMGRMIGELAVKNYLNPIR
jgi:hypothetical protein